MNSQSCIYEGDVWHRRFDPRHEFRYRIFMLYIDLDEVTDLFRKYWFWSARYPNIAWFRRADHVGPFREPLSETIRQLVERETGSRPEGPIRLLTQLRYFGFVINPICLYYCFDPLGRLEFAVAEVTNTPWGERHCYVLDVREQIEKSAIDTAVLENVDRYTRPRNRQMIRISGISKMLHVSPFMDMKFSYEFGIAAPGEELLVQVANWRLAGPDRQRFFDATLKLKRNPITRLHLLWVLCRYPLMTVQIWFAIHWQALRLWVKGAKFHRHPESMEVELNRRPDQLQSRGSTQPALVADNESSMANLIGTDRSPGALAGAAIIEKDLENVAG